jgi:hypothetical protein
MKPMEINSNARGATHQRILAHLRTLRTNLEEAREALLHYKDDRVDRDKLEPAARRVDDLMNMFTTGSKNSTQALEWMSGIQNGVNQVLNPKAAAALHDAGIEIAELVAAMKTAQTQ